MAQDCQFDEEFQFTEEFQEKVRRVIDKILEASYNSGNNLQIFFDKIVEIGAEELKAVGCVIFLKDYPRYTRGVRMRGDILRLYASNKQGMGKTLGKITASYYIPKRKSFSQEKISDSDWGKGRKLVNKLLSEKYFSGNIGEEYDNLEPIDILKKKATCLMEVIEKKKWNLEQLIEDEELPMGITAFVAREGKDVILHGDDVRNHEEWRGSYEGLHEICTSLVEVPLKDANGEVCGVVKIENCINSDTFYDFNKLINIEGERNYETFDIKDKYILNILAISAMAAVKNVLSCENTYKKMIGIEMLKKIDSIQKIIEDSKNSDNISIFEHLKEFYNPLKHIIIDINKLETIFTNISDLVKSIADSLDLIPLKIMIDDIGSNYEELLGTDIKYREHFIHQFLVFLLGYYIINACDKFKNILLVHLKEKKNSDYGLSEILKVWFISSIFHDSWYSVQEIEKWFSNYLKSVRIEYDIKIPWSELFLERLFENTKLIELLANKTREQSNAQIINKLKDAFIIKHDHGLISGSTMLNELTKKNVLDSFLIEKICLAIILHTISIYSIDDDLRIDFKPFSIEESPFAFLLVFCDSAQQWGRLKMYQGYPDLNVKLKDVKINGGKEINVCLEYPFRNKKLDTQIDEKMNPPIENWFLTSDLQFKIDVWKYGIATTSFNTFYHKKMGKKNLIDKQHSPDKNTSERIV